MDHHTGMYLCGLWIMDRDIHIIAFVVHITIYYYADVDDDVGSGLLNIFFRFTYALLLFGIILFVLFVYHHSCLNILLNGITFVLQSNFNPVS